ncbi:MAG: hypothetical protein ACLSHU_13235 [Oscillospiraceae bacterium]
MILYVPDPESEYDIVSFSLTNFEVPFITTYSAYVTYLEQNPAADGLYRVEVTWNPSTVDGQMSAFPLGTYRWPDPEAANSLASVATYFRLSPVALPPPPRTSMSSPAGWRAPPWLPIGAKTTNLEESGKLPMY